MDRVPSKLLGIDLIPPNDTDGKNKSLVVTEYMDTLRAESYDIGIYTITKK